MNSKAKLAILCTVSLAVAGVWWMSAARGRSSATLTYSDFLEKVRTSQIAGVTILGNDSGAVPATCQLKDGSRARTVLPLDYRDALLLMQDKLVNIEIRDSASAPLHLLANAAPFLVLLAVWIFLMFRKFPNGPGPLMSRRLF